MSEIIRNYTFFTTRKLNKLTISCYKKYNFLLYENKYAYKYVRLIRKSYKKKKQPLILTGEVKAIQVLYM